MIAYRGLSKLDGVTPIVVVLTGIDAPSLNSKTGAMVQSWILVERRTPWGAWRDGTDKAICGDCVHRGDELGHKRSCYVNLGHGPAQVMRTVERGDVYPDCSGLLRGVAAHALAGRSLRIGSYGDPAAVPASLWRELLSEASHWTGYTHQWRRYPEGQSFLMASVETAEERFLARAAGWRTFRVRRVTNDGPSSVLPGEAVCPASHEGGRAATCESCGLCKGASLAKDVAIVDHSTSALARLQRSDRRQLPMVYR